MKATLWQRLTQGTRRLHYRPDWPMFLGSNWPDRVMTCAVTDRFHAKQGRSTGRWILELPGQKLSVYLKRHHRLPRWLGWLACLLPDRGWSPAFQEYNHLHWAEQSGFAVPRTVAAGEYIGPWGRLQSFLAVEELTGMLPAHEAIPLAAIQLAPRDFAEWKKCLIYEMARIARRLHDQRRFHKDLYLCHFYIPETEIRPCPSLRGRLHLIDLHRLGYHPRTWPVWLVKDLAQLLYSSTIRGVTVRDRIRFWRVYLGPSPGHWSKCWLRRLILAKWKRYERHNAKQARRNTPESS